MSVIEHIEINCVKQEDSTGSDDLKFYVNGIHVGNVDGVSSGDYKDVTKSLLYGELWVDEGSVLKIEEYDALDNNDVLVEYTITGSDISNGSVFLRDQITSAEYEFTVHIVNI
jgi:hypothetical protein